MALVTLLIAGISTHDAQTLKKFWVFFSDKGPDCPSAGFLPQSTPSYEQALRMLSPRALARRAKVLPGGGLVDAADAPLYSPYIQTVEKLGGTLGQQSRWLNGASFFLPDKALPAVHSLTFVRSVRPVARMSSPLPIPRQLQPSSGFAKIGSLNYGSSEAQVDAVDVPRLHALGITGRKILVGMLDSGFRWRAEESLRTRNVIAEYDFVFHDSVTANESNDSPDQDGHGTLTMSVLAGYAPGKLIGPAFDADLILGKTEYIPTETRQEEDNWAAGIEWMEGYGVDVVSSSLGYDTFDPPDSGYSWLNNDFNGRTSITAQAAERACKLGVVVCSAMGNEGNNNTGIGTLLTPADTDTLISVGAVNFTRQLASFSSQGPTSDGRTKPDVVAPGINVIGAIVPGPATYGSANGTSLSTPLVSGSAALLLSARPELTPFQVRAALRSTAIPITDPVRFPSSPNNFTGWGLIDAFRAALSFGPIFSNRPMIDAISGRSIVSIAVASQFGIKRDSVIFHYCPGNSSTWMDIPMSFDTSFFYPTSGIYRIEVPRLAYGTPARFTISAVDSASNSYASPAPFYDTTWSFRYGMPDPLDRHPIPASHLLKQNFPNPFNGSTTISFDLPSTEHVRIRIYDILGRIVATLLDQSVDAGDASSRSPIIFNAEGLPSGVYYCQLYTPTFTQTTKLLLLR
ncbi:MAG TPA: S8/S53 family peptidase [Bacteroidota bacterium]|nr:S8/S53 family peptidase [Bacteroidota bacterium]